MTREGKILRIAVIGTGYIGLPTAALLASKGFLVTAVDINPNVIRQINDGVSPSSENGLQALLTRGRAAGCLVASDEVPISDVFLITVPTPITELFKPDLRHVYDAVDAILDKLRFGNIVIIESTIPVNTTQNIAKIIKEKRPELFFADEDDNIGIKIAHCPERVLPGNLIEELVHNDRVIGGIDEHSTQSAIKFYSKFVKGAIYGTDSRTAELSKLAENTYRDVNIAFANELSQICDELSINVWELIELTNRHPRVQILNPGPGVGGHCIAVDPWFIAESVPQISKLIQVARQVNLDKERFVVAKILESLKEFDFKNLTLYGLTYKKNVDDFRNSPSINILKQLSELPNLKIEAVDPYFSISKHANHVPTSAKILSGVGEPKKDHLHVVLVGHDAFLNINNIKYPDLRIINFCERNL